MSYVRIDPAVKAERSRLLKLAKKERDRVRNHQRRIKKALAEGRVLRKKLPPAQSPEERRQRRIVQKRNARMAQGKTPKKLQDAHVRLYRVHSQPHPAMQRIETFIGPPKPTAKSIGNAAYAKWRYWNGGREYQINKRKKAVAEVPLFYARERLGIKNAPTALVEAKRYFLLIKRMIGETSNEDD